MGSYSSAVEAPGTERQPRSERLAHGRLHLLLSCISLVVVLISVNRKSSGGLAFVADNEFLRWSEFDNMVLGLCTVLLYHLATAHLTYARRAGGAGDRTRARESFHGRRVPVCPNLRVSLAAMSGS